MAKVQGGGAKHNPAGQEVKSAGYKKKDMGFGEDLSKATGPAGRGTPNSGDKCNTPDGQTISG